MPLSKRSRGERDAPRTSEPTGQQHGDAPRTSEPTGQPHGDAPRTSEPTGQQHLYLIFDDWEWGYSIRKLNLANAGGEQRCLPPPFIRLEARRGRPKFFAAVGTKILATRSRFEFVNANAMEPGGILPIVDVRSRGVIFGPGQVRQENPIYLPLGDELFALDTATFEMLSMKPMWPPRLEYEHRHQISLWSWVNLPMPTFQRMDVTSYAVGSDGQTILFSTDAATFSFDCQRHEWKKLLEWSLPFSGQAYYVHDLDVFVGLPEDVDDDSGRLCFCRWSGDDKHVWLSKENLSSKDSAENHHVGTSLVYLGGSRFCLVECLGNGSAKAVQEWLEKWQEKWVEGQTAEEGSTEEEDSTEEEGCPLGLGSCCLTTFSLSSDMNGDLMAAKTAVQCYKMPWDASPNVNPVAFWL